MLCPVNTTARTHCLRSPKGCKRKAADAELETKDPKGRDQYAELFSRVEPRHIPESRAWWQRQQTELMSISDDSEYGLMTSMVTSTQNDLSPELLAHARRGPCVAPTEAEMFEYLLSRRAPGEKRANVQEDAAAATLSYQRRLQAM